LDLPGRNPDAAGLFQVLLGLLVADFIGTKAVVVAGLGLFFYADIQLSAGSLDDLHPANPRPKSASPKTRKSRT
jgi:hypothetical protein